MAEDLDSLSVRPSRLDRFREWMWKDVRPTDCAIVILTAGLLLTSYLQWKAIRDGSADTHALAVAAQKQAEAAVAQVELTREQLRGTEAAFLDVEPQLDGGSSNVTVWVYNDGRATAHAIDVRIKVTQESIPSERAVGAPVSFEYSIPVLSGLVNTGARYGDSRMFQIPTLDWPDVLALKRVLQVDLQYRFNDGFEDISSNSCFAWLGYGNATQPPARMTCDQVSATIQARLRKLQ